jgi:hypothetical protein
MDLATVLLFLLGSVLIVRELVKRYGNTPDNKGISLFAAFCVLVSAGYLSKHLTRWLVPGADVWTKLGVGLPLYYAALAIFLICYDVRPARALLIAAVVVPVMLLRTILFVALGP